MWLPQKWVLNRPENSITLTVLAGEKLQSKKIVEAVQPKKGVWTHHIVIMDEKDLDEEIKELIKASYDFYLNRKAC